jgi:FKBP-type peptidyl-prolyl cis-trans isomerase FklB
MKKFLFCAFVFSTAAGTISAQVTTPASDKPLLKNMNDSFSYAAGCNIAMSMKEQGIININGALLQKAIEDVLNSKTPLLTPEQANNTLQQQLQALAAKKSETQKAEGNKFLEENKKRPGVTVLPDGLQYEVIKAGTDPVRATAQDTVVVHYIGTFINGLEFDNSVSRGQPATFALGEVIPGWTEILQLMPKGSQWKVYVPSDLAYGERGRGPTIPPGTALVFDLTLIDIKPVAKQ